MNNTKHIKAIIEKTFHLFGFQRLSLPLISSSELFIKRLGQQVKSQMFIFKDQKNQELALRPEMTSLVVKHFLKQTNTKLPLRLYYSGTIFKQDNYKKDYLQIGTEIIGTNQTYDAENIALAINCIEKLGIKNYSLTLSNLGILNYVIQNMNADDSFKNIFFENIKQKEKGIAFIKENLRQNQTTDNNKYNDIIEILKKLKPKEEKKLLSSLLQVINPNIEDSIEENNEIIEGILDKIKRQNIAADIEKILAFIEKLFSIKQTNNHNKIIKQTKTLLKTENIPLKYIDELEYTLDFLTEYGIPKENIKLDFATVRNLNYYTGMIFDITVNNITIAKGGRYDKLIASFNNKYDLPGFGFIFELEKLVNIITTNKTKKKERTELYIITDKQQLQHILKTIKTIRNNNITVITNIIDHKENKRTINSIIQEQNAKFILTFNEKENNYSLINLTNNKKESINIDSINNKILEIFNVKQ